MKKQKTISPRQPQTAKNIRLAFFADFHANNEDEIDRALKLIDDALKADPKPDHIIIGGDIVERAQKKLLNRFAAGLRKRKCLSRATIVPGNHDIFPVSDKNRVKSLFAMIRLPFVGVQLFYKLFATGTKLNTGNTYPMGRVISPDVLVVALNSICKNRHFNKLNIFKLASGELNNQDFHATKIYFRKHKEARHKIVLMHHCPWTPYSESQDDRFPMGMATPNHKKAPVLIKNTGATLVLCGHWHRHRVVGKRKLIGNKLWGFCAGTAGGAGNEEGDNTRMYHFIDLLPSGKFNIHPRRLRLK